MTTHFSVAYMLHLVTINQKLQEKNVVSVLIYIDDSFIDDGQDNCIWRGTIFLQCSDYKRWIILKSHERLNLRRCD